MTTANRTNAEAMGRNVEHLRTAKNCSCERLCERAAILEADAGMTRVDAEMTAAAWAANWARPGAR